MLALSVAHWLVELAMLWATFAAFGLDVPFATASVLVIGAVSLAALLPGLPANLGPFEMACVLALATFGVGQEVATGFAIVYHVLHTIPVTVAGLPGMWRPHHA